MRYTVRTKKQKTNNGTHMERGCVKKHTKAYTEETYGKKIYRETYGGIYGGTYRGTYGGKYGGKYRRT